MTPEQEAFVLSWIAALESNNFRHITRALEARISTNLWGNCALGVACVLKKIPTQINTSYLKKKFLFPGEDAKMDRIPTQIFTDWTGFDSDIQDDLIEINDSYSNYLPVTALLKELYRRYSNKPFPNKES